MQLGDATRFLIVIDISIHACTCNATGPQYLDEEDAEIFQSTHVHVMQHRTNRRQYGCLAFQSTHVHVMQLCALPRLNALITDFNPRMYM